MIILGLGTNLGDRLKQLRHALSLLQQLPGLSVKQVSPIYISDALLPENAPENWDTPFLNVAVRCETTLEPLELLHHIKQIEKRAGRTPEKHWGPRIIDIDILAWDDLIRYDEKLHIPHESLHERPFALWPLADIAPRWVYPLLGPLQGKTAAEIATKKWGSRFTGDAPLHTRQILHRIDTPALMGILSITPDSFSGDGLANIHDINIIAADFVTSGAEILDIGAEATGPSAIPIDAKTEWQRLEPVLKSILQTRSTMLITPKISIDTHHAEVAEKSLALGIDWINDVSGLDDPSMVNILKQHTCNIVFMHHLGIPVSNQAKTLPPHADPVKTIYTWAESRIQQLEKSGISSDRLIFDVGIGFGKTAEQSVEIMQRIAEFKNLGVKLLVGHSRKSFFNLFTPNPFSERDIETLSASLHLANESVDYLRVHNVNATSRAFKVMRSLAKPRSLCETNQI
jgi:2-amino-4-hydroxy-6-hydroxymethyldihydropteridine diphosphokinase / dihydropteroate synthase